MRYFKCEWHHSFEDEPVLMFYQLDEDRTVLRSVECFRNGSMKRWAEDIPGVDMPIESCPVPPLEEINADRQFRAVDIAAQEFDSIWEEATTKEKAT